MSVRNNNYSNVIKINFGDVQLQPVQKGVAPDQEFNASIEEQIEYLWSQSRSLGWGYDDFVIHLLQILAVVRFRDKLKLPSSPARKA